MTAKDPTVSGWVRVAVADRFQSPALTDRAREKFEATVTDAGFLETDSVPDQLRLQDSSALEPGTDVVVMLRGGYLHCKPMSEHERDKKATRAKRRAKQYQQRKQQEKQEQERREFWENYDIPIEFATGQNNRLGELQRGSTGTGATSSTVRHFVCLESLDEGRLKRDAGDFLCKNSGEFPDRPSEPEDEPPEITCQTCLDRMERWKES